MSDINDIGDLQKRLNDCGFSFLSLTKTRDGNLSVWGGDYAESPFITGSLSELASAFAKLSALFREADQADLIEMSEHLSGSGAWLGPDEVVMTVIIDEFDDNQCRVICPCGRQFDDWVTVNHICPECWAVDKGV